MAGHSFLYHGQSGTCGRCGQAARVSRYAADTAESNEAYVWLCHHCAGDRLPAGYGLEPDFYCDGCRAEAAGMGLPLLAAAA